MDNGATFRRVDVSAHIRPAGGRSDIHGSDPRPIPAKEARLTYSQLQQQGAILQSAVEGKDQDDKALVLLGTQIDGYRLALGQSNGLTDAQHLQLALKWSKLDHELETKLRAAPATAIQSDTYILRSDDVPLLLKFLGANDYAAAFVGGPSALVGKTVEQAAASIHSLQYPEEPKLMELSEGVGNVIEDLERIPVLSDGHCLFHAMLAAADRSDGITVQDAWRHRQRLLESIDGLTDAQKAVVVGQQAGTAEFETALASLKDRLKGGINEVVAPSSSYGEDMELRLHAAVTGETTACLSGNNFHIFAPHQATQTHSRAEFNQWLQDNPGAITLLHEGIHFEGLRETAPPPPPPINE